MLYFAYGSNMDPGQMAKRCPGATPAGAAVLRGHRLVFTWDSEWWRGGVGHVVPDDGDVVWGVLWELTPEDEASLDGYERVDQGVYRKDHVVVENGEGPVKAMIYLCNDEKPKRPSRRYVDALVRGARAHGVPDDYIARLEQVRTGSA